MYDRELALDILSQIYEASQTVLKRFKPIKSVNNFIDSPSGMEKLDSICMKLIAIGEGLKNLDKVTNKKPLPRYQNIEWKKAMALRDILITILSWMPKPYMKSAKIISQSLLKP